MAPARSLRFQPPPPAELHLRRNQQLQPPQSIFMETSTINPTRCPIVQMEQPVIDYIKCMLMEEDKSPETRHCVLDNDDDCAAAVLYQTIMKDFLEIVGDVDYADGNRSVVDRITSLSSDSSVARPADLAAAGIINSYGVNYSSPSAMGSANASEDDLLHDEQLYSLQNRREMELLQDSRSHDRWTEGESPEDYLVGGNGSGSTSTTTSDEIDASFTSEQHLQRRSSDDSVEWSSSDDSVEFGVWVDQVLSSATLVNDDADIGMLQSTISSAAAAAAATSGGGQLIHGVKQQASVQFHHEQSRAIANYGAPYNNDTTDTNSANGSRSRWAAAAAPTMQQPPPKKEEEADFFFNEDLGEAIQAGYQNLYAAAMENGRSKERSGKSERGSKRKSSNSAPGYYDLEELLLSCAQAVSRSDTKKAREILAELRRQGATLQGRSCLHRMAYQFCRALEARLDGSGAALYAAETAQFASVTATESISAWLCMFDNWHYIKISHFFANQSFLSVANGRQRLHVVDYGISYGSQWAYLIKALSEREGGPPLLILTGVQFPPSSPSGCGDVKWAMPLALTGRRLAEFAGACKVPFRFHGVESARWEDLEAEALMIEAERRSETALAVNVIKQLQFIPDETVQEEMYRRVAAPAAAAEMSPRQKLLCRIRSLNPDVLMVGVSNAGFNVPTFLTRFKDVLHHFSSIVDMTEVTTEESPERRLMERLFWRGIINVVACEGADRVIRPETYRQWHRRLQRAGFHQAPVPSTVLARSVHYVKERYHRDCTVMVDHSSPWLLMGWRGRTYLAMSGWTPC